MTHIANEFYIAVQSDQVSRLMKFRAAHPYKALEIAGVRWEYIACGCGEETLLMLPGGLRVAETCFVQIESFEKDYRVIVPTYPRVWTMDEITDGLMTILNMERVAQVNVLGQSYGGWVAQVLARRYPMVVKRLILSGTGPLTVTLLERAGSFMALLLLPLLPEWLLMSVLKHGLLRLVTVAESEYDFWRTFIDDLFTHRLNKADVLSHFRTGADVLKKGYIFAKGEKSQWPGEVLLILGENDPVVSVTDQRRIREIYAHVQIRYIGDAGHTVGLANPTRYAALVNGFIHTSKPEKMLVMPV
jgi:pimeloyl-ACP methyl ester carboxylesterase